MFYKPSGEIDGIRLGFTISIGVLLIVVISIAVWPIYGVWQAKLSGEAEFKKAEQNRRIRILEAEAEKESAKLEAEAEVERAKGVAQANEIIADGLRGRTEYLQYLWINHLESGQNREVIYVPTEAGLPILEAGQR